MTKHTSKQKKRRIFGILIGIILASGVFMGLLFFYTRTHLYIKTSKDIYAGMNQETLEKTAGRITLYDLKKTNRNLKIKTDKRTGVVTDIRGKKLSKRKIESATDAYMTLIELREVMRLTEFRYMLYEELHSIGKSVYTLRQTLESIPICGTGYRIFVENGYVTRISGNIARMPELKTEPVIDKTWLESEFELKDKSMKLYKAELVILTDTKEPTLTWRCSTKKRISIKDETVATIWIDAMTGDTISDEEGEREQPLKLPEQYKKTPKKSQKNKK